MRNYHFVEEVTFKNWIQETLDTIVGEKKAAIKNRIILHLSTICYITDVSDKLNESLFVISLELIGILTSLLCRGSNVEKNSFTRLKMYTSTCKLKLK